MNLELPTCDETDCSKNAGRQLIVEGRDGYVFTCHSCAELHYEANTVNNDEPISTAEYRKLRGEC